MKRARTGASWRIAASCWTRRSANMTAALSNIPATACWWRSAAVWGRAAAEGGAAGVRLGMSRRTHDVTEDERISLRIGINLGDVIAEPEDIYGDGVNVAARLEGLAEPNGICISQTVYEQVRDKLPYPFEDLGHLSVKNIARPLHAFALRPEVIAELSIETVPAR